MSENNEMHPLFADDGDDRDGKAESLGEHAAQMSEEAELKALLGQWQTPSIPAALDSRILTAFRQQTRRAPLWKRIFSPKSSSSANREVIIMKQCSLCREEFADKFSFCPLDGSPLNELAAAIVASPPPELATGASQARRLIAYSSGEYHLTIIEDEGLTSRLREELGEVARESQLTWPEFRRDPFSFVKRSATAYSLMLWRFFRSPNVAVATLTAIVFILSISIGLVVMDRWRASHAQQVAERVREDLEYLGDATSIPAEEQARREGAAGTNKGTGGGSKPKQDKPGGGGGGGREEQKPASYGKLPQASLTIPQ
ncbi:MAG TPA: hypothetical protein VF553_10685, partial [Pyrinomonadaceae bacterium]